VELVEWCVKVATIPFDRPCWFACKHYPGLVLADVCPRLGRHLALQPVQFYTREELVPWHLVSLGLDRLPYDEHSGLTYVCMVRYLFDLVGSQG